MPDPQSSVSVAVCSRRAKVVVIHVKVGKGMMSGRVGPLDWLRHYLWYLKHSLAIYLCQNLIGLSCEDDEG